MQVKPTNTELTFSDFKDEVMNDLRLAWQSRYFSTLARKEVLRGKAKFGIMGAGKELPQIALSKFFKNGDFRAGYYRDQTIALATELSTIRQLFALLYANENVEQEPSSAGRQMNSHFSTRLLDNEGNWKDHLAQKNHSADAAPTASQMGRAVGLGLASKLYRDHPEFAKDAKLFTNEGDEITFVTIGDASTSEGIFWEAMNTIGVLQVPAVVSVWDDGYGISVPTKLQTTKANISEALAGFQRTDEKQGFEIIKVKAWDYPALVSAYEQATSIARNEHTPVLVHVTEVTQPQGHSTSGSHERYKSDERLNFEKEFDCITKFEEWLINNGITDEESIEQLRQECSELVKGEMKLAWDEFLAPVKQISKDLLTLLEANSNDEQVSELMNLLANEKEVKRWKIDYLLRQFLVKRRNNRDGIYNAIQDFHHSLEDVKNDVIHSKLFTDSPDSPLQVDVIDPIFNSNSELMNGYEILNACFNKNLEKYQNLIAFGEDVGMIGGVNQGFAGMQEKYGDHRVFDVGIREGTIIGQGIGLALRGFRPIAEIQYLDYLLYGLQQLSDELATLSYRTKGGQKSPLIVRTRGHRLEGIWHTGSPMAMILNAVRGVHLLVPRNMTQAAGFYNTLLQGDEPAIVVEVLSGYRLKERLPDNIGEYTVPIGKVEKLRSGTDATVVTYGACVAVVEKAAKQLDELGISIELIDIQSLLPFDLEHKIVESVKKTNRLVVVDEDVPGGASAYLLQKILEEQGAYQYLDSMPITLTAREHRVGYGADHAYFAKPQDIDVVESIYALISESNPSAFPTMK